MRIALVSLDQVWEDKLANQIKCEVYLEKASTLNARLVVFPEMTLTGFSMNTGLSGENSENSATIKFFSKLAKRYNLYIAFGIVFKKKTTATNNFIIIDGKGNLCASYTKIHPFSYSGEDSFFEGGHETVVCDIDGIKCGLSVCYDLRFPELFQNLSKKAELIITIANWPKERVGQWLTLLKARAIENQVFFVGVNRTGIDGNRIEYEKSSVVFSPEGNEVKCINSDNHLDIIDLKMEEVMNYRSSFPMKKDRRTNLYREFYETEG